jgi:hypothetical protein
MPKMVQAANDLTMIWLHAVQLLAQTSRGLKKLRKLESNIGNDWLDQSRLNLESKAESYDAAVSCGDLLNNYFSGNLVYEVTKIGEIIRVHIQACPIYTNTYNYTRKKNMKLFSFNASIMVAALKRITGRDFRTDLNKFNSEEEIIDFLPLEVGLTIILSLKLTKGTIKISEADAKELGLGIIDNVTVRHVKSGKSFIGISYTSSKLSRGLIFLSLADARIQNFEEGEKVIIEKTSGQEDVAELVELGEYGI